MKYINAADVLPEELLKKLQAYVKGDILYVPNDNNHIKWGEKSGSRTYYMKRNSEIKKKYKDGTSITEISDLYGLAFDTIKKIVYS